MSTDDIDLELEALLGDRDAELEARFRELEGGADLEALKREAARQGPGADAAPADDPLAAMKASVDGRARPKRPYVVLLCPSCGGKNRASVERLREELPRCGRCKAELATLR